VQARIAIVSANAFDKSLDNDVGVRAEDFITKPVRHSELLDWLERQLALRWLPANTQPAQREPEAKAIAAETAWQWPAAEDITALREAAQLGYYRGIMNRLDSIEATQPQCAAFVAAMRELARQFGFEAMVRKLEQEVTP
jgi:hypothetical protein